MLFSGNDLLEFDSLTETWSVWIYDDFSTSLHDISVTRHTVVYLQRCYVQHVIYMRLHSMPNIQCTMSTDTMLLIWDGSIPRRQ